MMSAKAKRSTKPAGDDWANTKRLRDNAAKSMAQENSVERARRSRATRKAKLVGSLAGSVASVSLPPPAPQPVEVLDARGLPPVAVLEGIAKRHLRIDTLEARNSDALDFHDIGTLDLRAALEAAYLAGARAQGYAMLKIAAATK